ncbi:MAG: hypothetical protein JWR60_3477, partial [Polaromonas sp.]|nr:hypothetical protein [Polaromonas sp.]
MNFVCEKKSSFKLNPFQASVINPGPPHDRAFIIAYGSTPFKVHQGHPV